MKNWVLSMFLLLLAMGSVAEVQRSAGYMPMPPSFSLEADRDDVLTEYPLGVITRMAAFSHHGQAHKNVRLPNGLEGWVYENTVRDEKRYVLPSGEERERRVLEGGHVVSTYTLVFSGDGVVIDVLYQEPGKGKFASALLLQREARADTEIDPWRPGDDG